MPFFTWSENLSVNVPEMDAQHKRLVDLINQLHDAMAKGQGQAVLRPLFDGLIRYAGTHFGTEEKYMQQQNFAGLPEQSAAHQQFTTTVQDLRKRFDGGQTLLGVETMNFLKDWLVKHIQGADKKYAPRAVPAATAS